MATDTERYGLASSTLIEPLVNHWYAYAQTVAPVAASMQLIGYQLDVLESFCSDPKFHYQTYHDKRTLGGPFVGISPERADEVRTLLERTTTLQASNIALGNAIRDFERTLQTNARGHTIEPFYAALPDALKGYCELGYDYANHPILRVIEAVVYRGPCYDRSLQSLLIQRLERDDGRPFFQSTPRLGEAGQLAWNVPFDSEELDAFFDLEYRPKPLGEIRELLRVPSTALAIVRGLLEQIDSPRPEPSAWRGPGVRLRYFGHACVLLEVEGFSLLTDPSIAVRAVDSSVERLSFRDLPAKIDYVLLTHSHGDHTMIETLLRLRRKLGTVIVPKNHGLFHGDLSLKLLLRAIGFPRVVEVDAFDALEAGPATIVAVPSLGEHGDLLHAKTSYVVGVGDMRVCFAADSNCLDVGIYERIRANLGPVDTVFLGMECAGAPLAWQYGPLLQFRPAPELNQSRRLSGCDATRALALLRALGARRFFVYGMGREPWLEYIMALALTEDSFQMKEVRRALHAAKGLGLEQAETLFGSFDLVI